MRYINDIMLERAVLHVIDATADEAILASKELTINEEVEEFVRKHVIKPLNSSDTYSAKFLSDEVAVAVNIKAVIANNDEFMDVSRGLANKMYDSIKNSDIPSGDLLFVQYIADEQRCFAIIKLDYQMSQSHVVTFEEDEDEPRVNLVTSENVLPKAGFGFKKCAFFTKGAEDTIEMIVVNKRQKIEDGNAEYFMEDFLEAVIMSDDTSKTRNFKATVEHWTQKNLSDQIEQANIVREVVNETLFCEEVVNTDEMAEILFGDEELEPIKESFKESMADAGYKSESEFEIDKHWVEKKLKSKVIKTDTGVAIKGELDFFKDAQRFVIKQNGDGTCDYVIKNVRNVVERKGSQ